MILSGMLLAMLGPWTAPAAAHVGGVIAFEAAVSSLDPAGLPLDVEVVEEGAGLAITSRTNADVVVLDPDGQPFGRIDEDGAFRRHWPYEAGDEILWDRVGDGPELRLAYPWISTVPDSFNARRAVSGERVKEWSVPVNVDGRQGSINGELIFRPGLSWAQLVEYSIGGLIFAGMLGLYAWDARRRSRRRSSRPEPDAQVLQA